MTLGPGIYNQAPLLEINKIDLLESNCRQINLFQQFTSNESASHHMQNGIRLSDYGTPLSYFQTLKSTLSWRRLVECKQEWRLASLMLLG